MQKEGLCKITINPETQKIVSVNNKCKAKDFRKVMKEIREVLN